MQSELKPCPFCGGEAMIAATLDDMYRPMCKKDGCAFLESNVTRAESITAWNHRSVDASTPQVQHDAPFAQSDIVQEARLDAKAFRENAVYTSDGQRVKLGAVADRLDDYADEITRLTEALRLQMEAKHKEAAEAKLWFHKAQEWGEALRAAEEREKALREVLVVTEGAIAEYYRYWTGGETRGSYDGEPERAGLWKARQIARQSIAAAIKEQPHD